MRIKIFLTLICFMVVPCFFSETATASDPACPEGMWFHPKAKKCIEIGEDPTGEVDREFARELAREQSLNGQYVEDSSLLDKYGKYAFETFRRFPSLVYIIRRAKRDFKPRDVGTSFPTSVFKFNDGKKCLILGGCTPHDCGGTQNVIVYDFRSNTAYVLREDYSQNGFRIYGSPPRDIRNLLIYHYENR